MSELSDHRVLLGGLDVSGIGNRLSVQYRPVEADGTTFGRISRTTKTSGAWTKVTGEIFLDSRRPGVRAVREILTLVPEHTRIGDEGITISKVNGICKIADETLPSWDVELEAVGSPLIRGVVMFEGFTNVSGHGRSLAFTAVPPHHRLVSVCHVVEMNASYVRLSLEREVSHVFRPEVVHHFPHTSGVGAQWRELPGPLAHSLWRATWDTDGEFEALLLVGL